MKKIVMFFVVLALLLAALPATALAKEPVTVELNVRNRAKYEVQLQLKDAYNNIRTFVVPAGLSTLDVQEGRYEYWASLPCGNVSGIANVNVVKTLVLECPRETPHVYLVKNKKSAGQGFGCPFTTPDSGPEYGIYLPWSNYTFLEFFSLTNWNSAVPWSTVEYWNITHWSDPTNPNGPELMGCYGYYDPAVITVGHYFTSIWFPNPYFSKYQNKSPSL